MAPDESQPMNPALARAQERWSEAHERYVRTLRGLDQGDPALSSKLATISERLSRSLAELHAAQALKQR